MEEERAPLSRFEAARIIGLRALQLSTGTDPCVVVADPALSRDFYYVAARELAEKRLDAVLMRDGEEVRVASLDVPRHVLVMLDNKDGGCRSYGAASLMSFP